MQSPDNETSIGKSGFFHRVGVNQITIKKYMHPYTIFKTNYISCKKKIQHHNFQNTYRRRFLFPVHFHIEIDDSQSPKHSLELIINVCYLKDDGNIN